MCKILNLFSDPNAIYYRHCTRSDVLKDKVFKGVPYDQRFRSVPKERREGGVRQYGTGLLPSSECIIFSLTIGFVKHLTIRYRNCE